MAGKYRLSTLGCKVNQYESQQIREALQAFGLHPARPGEPVDLAVVNTCAVTASASSKSRQAVRRLARSGDTSVVVVGCSATADAGRLRAIDGVIAVWGHDVDIAAELPKLLHAQHGRARNRPAAAAAQPAESACRRQPAKRNDEECMSPLTPGTSRRASARQADHMSDRSPPRVTAKQPPDQPSPIIPGRFPIVKTKEAAIGRIERFDGHQRAFLKVQDGCDAFCTYCIIPKLRPALRSKPIETAVAEARSLVGAGHREIIVTGIFLGAYGRETALRKRFDRRPSPLALLIDALARVEGLARLRLSSLEPGDVDEALLEVLASHNTCVPHLHLPLQSGSEDILRAMNRQYTRDDFLDMVERVRAALERPAITTDIIVGFPGETEDDFQASVDMARYAEFTKIHAFPFSPREGTAAARWQRRFVPPGLARERMQHLAEIEQECALAFRRRALGTVERVLVEGDAAGHDADAFDDLHHGRSDRYFEVFFDAPGLQPGDLASVRIDRVTPTRTHGTYLPAGTDCYPLPVLAS